MSKFVKPPSRRARKKIFKPTGAAFRGTGDMHPSLRMGTFFPAVTSRTSAAANVGDETFGDAHRWAGRLGPAADSRAE